jgi:hypothetical protein
MESGEKRDPSAPTADERRMVVELRPSAAVRSRMRQMSSDLGKVISSAERAAERITADARRRAERRIAEAEREAGQLGAARARRLAELTDGLAEQVETVRRHSNDLMAAMERRTREVEQAYATMVESLASVSEAIMATTDRPAAGEIEEISLAQRHEVSFTVPRRTSAERPEIRGTSREVDR